MLRVEASGFAVGWIAGLLEPAEAALRADVLRLSESDPGVRPCRILVVDDNPLFLTTVGDLLTEMPGVEVVGLILSGREALEVVGHLRPDLVLSDLAMPDIGGLELSRQLCASMSSPSVVIMTVDDQPGYRAAAMAAGAAGFISKADLVIQLPILIRQLLLDRGTALEQDS